MKRIIAGGTGFIGKHLVNHWLAQGHDIAVVGRSAEKIQEIFKNKVEAIAWSDLSTTSFDDVELVVNLTGAGIGDKRWTDARKQQIISSRLNASNKICQLLMSLPHQAPALFNASAIGIYGLQESMPDKLPERLDETTAIDWAHAPDFLSQVARQWEAATHQASKSGIRVVNTRFAVVLSKEGGALPQMALPFKFGLGGIVGSGDQAFSWVMLEDLIRALDFLAENKNLSGPFNIVAPGCVMQREFAKTLAKVMHRPCFLKLPAFLLKLMFGEMAEELLLSGQHVYPSYLLQTGFSFHYPDIESALKKIYS